MLYFQLVIMAATIMLAYYFEYTDTFGVHVQGFFCYDSAYTKPYLGPEEQSAVPPALLYALVAGVPTLVVSTHSNRPLSVSHRVRFNGGVFPPGAPVSRDNRHRIAQTMTSQHVRRLNRA